MHVIGAFAVLYKLEIVLCLQPMHYSGGNALINLSHVLHCNLTLPVIGQSCDTLFLRQNGCNQRMSRSASTSVNRSKVPIFDVNKAQYARTVQHFLAEHC